MEPAPKSAITDFGDQPGLTNLLVELGQTPARQRQVESAGQFASQRFNLHDQFWGGKARGRPGRGSSSSPRKRSWKKRLRHWLTTSRRVFNRVAMRSLGKSSAAMRTILARK